jgi:hypothetical protein
MLCYVVHYIHLVMLILCYAILCYETSCYEILYFTMLCYESCCALCCYFVMSLPPLLGGQRQRETKRQREIEREKETERETEREKEREKERDGVISPRFILHTQYSILHTPFRKPLTHHTSIIPTHKHAYEQ